jgi:hypothetical protein
MVLPVSPPSLARRRDNARGLRRPSLVIMFCRMPHPRRRFPALLVPAFLLAGCADRIWLDHESAGGITLHWYTREMTIDAATARANAHCRSFGRHASLLDEFEDQDVATAHFACR